LRRSRLLAGALCAMHGAAVCAVLVVPWPTPARLALLIALAASLVHSLRPPRVVSLRLYRDGLIECVLPDGTRLPASPRPDTVVFSWLVVLRIDTEGKTISLPLLPDHMSREEFRILRLWLRWGIDPGKNADLIG
jgi:hypothetical protein